MAKGRGWDSAYLLVPVVGGPGQRRSAFTLRSDVRPVVEADMRVS